MRPIHRYLPLLLSALFSISITDAFAASRTIKKHVAAPLREQQVFKRYCRPGQHRLRARTVDIDEYRLQPEPNDRLGPLDFGVTDSLFVPDDARPALLHTISNPRDAVAILLLAAGCSVAFHNMCGIYGPSYEISQQASIALGLMNVLAVFVQLNTSFLIAKRKRMGVVDDAALTLYAGLYSAAACWLALRTSTFCPLWLSSFDSVLPWASAGIFGFSLLAPAVTLYEHYNSQERNGAAPISSYIVSASRLMARQEEYDSNIPTTLSETELFRTRGLLFIGLLGCVFVPACLAFAFKGDAWWQNVIVNHPKQNLLESTDALFALFATEASMIATRAANAGVAPYRKAVPVFAGVCLILALVPCGCSLIWLGGGDDISFFSFYNE